MICSFLEVFTKLVEWWSIQSKYFGTTLSPSLNLIANYFINLKTTQRAIHIHITVLLPSSRCLGSTTHPLNYNLLFFLEKALLRCGEELWHPWKKNIVWNLGMISVLFQGQSSIRTEAFFYSTTVWYCCASYCRKKGGSSSASLVSGLFNCGRDLEKVHLYFRMQTEH